MVMRASREPALVICFLTLATAGLLGDVDAWRFLLAWFFLWAATPDVRLGRPADRL